jgi:hypothetical protein
MPIFDHSPPQIQSCFTAIGELLLHSIDAETMVASVTTSFRPDPTCFTPSNLWLQSWYECKTYYTPFSPRLTEVVTPASCPHTRLGRPANYDDLCYQENWITIGSTIADNTAYSACPEGWTGVTTWTTTYYRITVERTACCPT